MKIPQISNELYNTLNPQNKEKLYIVEKNGNIKYIY